MVVGHVMFSYIDLVGEETWKVLALAPVAVLPKFQKGGISSALIATGLEKADVMGESMAFVLGYPQFYSRFGFESSVNYGIESPFSVPEDMFMVKPLTNYQHSFRGKVVYPAAFDGV